MYYLIWLVVSNRLEDMLNYAHHQGSLTQSRGKQNSKLWNHQPMTKMISYSHSLLINPPQNPRNHPKAGLYPINHESHIYWGCFVVLGFALPQASPNYPRVNIRKDVEKKMGKPQENRLQLVDYNWLMFHIKLYVYPRISPQKKSSYWYFTSIPIQNLKLPSIPMEKPMAISGVGLVDPVVHHYGRSHHQHGPLLETRTRPVSFRRLGIS